METYSGFPAGMFADGGLHEIAVSMSRKSYIITFYLDQKIMSTHSYVDDNRYYDSGQMPTFATGKVSLGAVHIPWKNKRYLAGFIGKMKSAYIDTDTWLPYQGMYKAVGFNERGYGSCIGYSDGLVDQGLCGDFYGADDRIFMPPQRFKDSAKAILDGVGALGQFVSTECRATFLQYSCSSFIMPCATLRAWRNSIFVSTFTLQKSVRNVYDCMQR